LRPLSSPPLTAPPGTALTNRFEPSFLKSGSGADRDQEDERRRSAVARAATKQQRSEPRGRARFARPARSGAVGQSAARTAETSANGRLVSRIRVRKSGTSIEAAHAASTGGRAKKSTSSVSPQRRPWLVQGNDDVVSDVRQSDMHCVAQTRKNRACAYSGGVIGSPRPDSTSVGISLAKATSEASGSTRYATSHRARGSRPGSEAQPAAQSRLRGAHRFERRG
jgi:hypothetical protein